MTKRQIHLTEKLQQKIHDEATAEQIAEIYGIYKKHNLITYLFKYFFDSNFAYAVELHKWLKEQSGHPIFEQIAAECMGDTNDKTMINILRYWVNNLYYKPDRDNYGRAEYWAIPEEILENGSGDCEDYMIMIYCTALAAGIPEYRMWCTIGWVSDPSGYQGKTGHAYITYIADNFVMYSIDGTYYPQESMRMVTPYYDHPLYFFGEEEWARFDTENTYKVK